MKKFTGGLGDDDDRETGDMMVWQKYFTKPIEETDFVVSTCKANGEAAHLSCIEVDGEYVLCGGSKNVHLLFKNKADIDNYVESRYRIATEICHTVMEFLDRLESMQRTELLAFLVASRYTAVFEILSPLHQHVVDLTHLKSPQLKFITWTKCELEASEKLQHLNVVPPHVGIEIARCLGLDPVDYEIMEMKDLEPHIKQIRQGFNTEGAVLYFHDNKGQVIGLLKKKSTWYIICRAIREKVKNAVSSMQRNPNTFSISRSLNQAEKRIKEIQQWLGLDDPTTREWMRLGSACVKWVIHEVEQGTLTKEEVADLFPVYWNRFLSETGNSDKVNVTDNSTDVGACKS
ncbi:uncharacterized protein LOC127845565 isoform X2 [Dreissena polymorpha]|nr:uncharacterized protein LOC127845565 isoform X2 [Dreissena polymorpha]